MELTLEILFAQEQLDKRNLTNKLNDTQHDVDIALRKITELNTSLKAKGIECLTVCEINQIISDYFNASNLEISSIDQGTMGELIFTTADPETPPIVVDLCPHVTYCQTDTTLASPTVLTLLYTAENHVDTLDLTPWFIADNIIWSGTATGRPQGTVQTIIDEVILEIDESIDCPYFTGTPVGLALRLDDLIDVNPSGDPVVLGDYLRYDGNNWQPTSTTVAWDCSELNSCSLNAIGNVAGSPDTGNILVGDGSGWNSTTPGDFGTTVLSAGNHWATWVPTAPGDSETYQVAITNTSTKSMTYFYTASTVIEDKRTAGNGVTALVSIEENGTSVSDSERAYVLPDAVANIEGGTFIYVSPTTRSFVLASGGTMVISLVVEASTLEVSYRDMEIFIYGLTTI